ncbi:MAG: class A beta-lactamase [Acidobacteria bacterium]|nr:class A beta-lactamase [Acidobacteriota bacterium]
MRRTFCGLMLACAGWAADPGLERLEREMARVARGAGAVAGASAIHIETGRRVSLRGGERFPMASTFKIPVAVELLRRVDAGDERLDRMITLAPEDLAPGSGTLSDLFNKPGVALSVRNLLELMLLISDNTATDILLREVGGAAPVTARMRALGIMGIDVIRPTRDLIADFRVSSKQFQTDARDTATPDSMASLLALIHERKLHKPASAELLLDILRRCRTGEARLKGLLPPGTEVAHKTGSMGRAGRIATNTNDAGIVTLPDGAGHVAIAAFVKDGEGPLEAQERAIAEIARAVHDYFLFVR